MLSQLDLHATFVYNTIYQAQSQSIHCQGQWFYAILDIVLIYKPSSLLYLQSIVTSEKSSCNVKKPSILKAGAA